MFKIETKLVCLIQEFYIILQSTKKTVRFLELTAFGQFEGLSSPMLNRFKYTTLCQFNFRTFYEVEFLF